MCNAIGQWVYGRNKMVNWLLLKACKIAEMMKLNGVNVMIKIIVLVVLIGFQIYSIYSIGIKMIKLNFSMSKSKL